ncbi:MAG: hypothetical protein LUG21_07480 [Clostridiales bacterium]|nr:hypothetical protein [Clostridiales bacterium]
MNKKRVTIIAVICIAIVLAAVGGTFVYKNYLSSNEKDESTSEEVLESYEEDDDMREWEFLTKDLSGGKYTDEEIDQMLEDGLAVINKFNSICFNFNSETKEEDYTSKLLAMYRNDDGANEEIHTNTYENFSSYNTECTYHSFEPYTYYINNNSQRDSIEIHGLSSITYNDDESSWGDCLVETQAVLETEDGE